MEITCLRTINAPLGTITHKSSKSRTFRKKDLGIKLWMKGFRYSWGKVKVAVQYKTG